MAPTLTRLTHEAEQSIPPSSDLRPTFGKFACSWIESNLVHGQGTRYGQPFRIRPDFRLFLYKWFEYDRTPAGGFRRWQHSLALREKAKGGAKTEENAAVAALSLFGPPEIATTSPDIPVAASSFEQADLLFGRVRQMTTHDNSPLRPYVEAYDTELLIKGRQGRLFRIAAQAGTQDGGLPSLAVGDELHEWTGSRARLELILAGNADKRDDSHGRLYGTTPGHDKETVAGLLHDKGVGGADERMLHQWITADPNLDLNNIVELEMAVRQANPYASEDNVERLCRRYAEIPEHEFRRYHLCQWVAIPEEGWLNDKPGAWEACQGNSEFTAQDPVVMWIDMSLNRDTTSVGAIQRRADGRKPAFARVFDPADSGGRIDFIEVRRFTISEAKRLRPTAIVYDPRFLEFEAQELRDAGLPMLEFPQSPERMSAGCGLTYDDISRGVIVHDGDPVFTRHVKAAVKRPTDRGFSLSKGKSKGPIDACIGLVMANAELSLFGGPSEPGLLITF